MKTTYGRATAAFITLCNMGRRMLPAKTAHSLFLIKKAIEPTYEFGSQQEKQFVTQVGAKLDENGNIEFPDIESRGAFLQKRNELYEMDVEFTLEQPTIDLNELKEASIAEIESLEGFINFK